MPAIDIDAVREALREVYDPEIPVNVVDLGLIYRIDQDDDEPGRLDIDMTLTAMGCPIADQILQTVTNAAESVEGVDHADVSLVFEPPWTPSLATESGKGQLRSIGISVPDDSAA